MQKVFFNPSKLESLAKEKYAVPPFLMMENAARGIADFILDFTPDSVLILCGKGNNGGDGYAVARLLQNKCQVSIIAVEPAAAEEAKAQSEMCRQLGLEIIESSQCLSGEAVSKPIFSKTSLILDCIYGTGFHGQLPENVKALLDAANKSPAIKIACDISSGLYFKADYTITMGSQKLSLYSDQAKEVSGKIIVQDLGIAREKFQSAGQTPAPTENSNETDYAWLIEASDIKLPFRKNRAAHKGTYGHTVVFCGEKAGAAILAASAAMNFGSGLTSLLAETPDCLAQFKISPALMLADSIPKKATALAAGSGFTQYSEAAAQKIKDWFKNQKNPAALFDAGMIIAPEFPALLKELNAIEGARIILTPHLAEFSTLLTNLGLETSLASLAQEPERKISLARKVNQFFPNTAVIIKSANTFIAVKNQIYILADGCQSLAKGGSGDILAGLAASLLAQGYPVKDAAITAAGYHAQLSRQLGEEVYNLTPEKLLDLI